MCGVAVLAGVEESTEAGAARVRKSIPTRSSEKMVDAMAQPKPGPHANTCQRAWSSRRPDTSEITSSSRRALTRAEQPLTTFVANEAKQPY